MSLDLIINGQNREFETLNGRVTLEELLAEMQLKGDRVAVELNGTIAPRAGWDQTTVAPGDRLEVVHFVGGGSPLQS